MAFVDLGEHSLFCFKFGGGGLCVQYHLCRHEMSQVPLQYSVEEMTVAVDPKTMLRKIMDNIPVSKEGVFSYKIKWDKYDAGMAGSNVTKWVGKKIHEMLGVEEPTLVNFIMQQLSQHNTPSKLLGELSPILDEETDPFVLKLYRMVIYETERAALGL